MTQQNAWSATISTPDAPDTTNQIITTDCVITVNNGAPLRVLDGKPIGEVTDARVVDGYLTVTGTLYPDQLSSTIRNTVGSGATDGLSL